MSYNSTNEPQTHDHLDQTLMRVDQATYVHFLEVFDQPPQGEGFERLMSAAKPWNN